MPTTCWEEDGQAEQPTRGCVMRVISVPKRYSRRLSTPMKIAAAPYHTFGTVHPGDIRYKDINGDSVIAQKTVPIGYADVPKLYYSANIGFSYKGFSLGRIYRCGNSHATSMAVE